MIGIPNQSRKRFSFALLLICICIASSINAQDLELDSVVNETLKKYDNLHSFYTEFSQTLCDEGLGACQIFEGKVYFLKPNFFRMEIEKPAQVYVGDSSSLWIYLPEKKRAIRQSLRQVPFAINPDLFLKDYKERFKAELSSTDNEYVITLLPKEETQIYSKIIVKTSKNNCEITGISIIDEAGAENKFIFSGMQLNKKISKNLFKFKPPKGTEIIDQ